MGRILLGVIAGAAGAYLVATHPSRLAEACKKLAAMLEGSDGDLDELTRDELYERAQEAEIPGRSGMTKDELAAALENG